jgi:hypothetical protein
MGMGISGVSADKSCPAVRVYGHGQVLENMSHTRSHRCPLPRLSRLFRSRHQMEFLVKSHNQQHTLVNSSQRGDTSSTTTPLPQTLQKHPETLERCYTGKTGEENATVPQARNSLISPSLHKREHSGGKRARNLWNMSKQSRGVHIKACSLPCLTPVSGKGLAHIFECLLPVGSAATARRHTTGSGCPDRAVKTHASPMP